MTRILKAACLISALLASTAAARAEDHISWLNDWLPAGDNAPIYYGVASGIFRDAGIDVSIDNAKGSSDAITRVAAGSADVTSSGLPALLQAAAEGPVPVRAVMSIYNTAPDAFVTTAASGITSVADLKGKTIATATFSSSNVLLPLVLEKNGLSPEDVKVQKVDPGALGPMLALGKVDAAIAWTPTAMGIGDQLASAGKTMTLLPWSQYGLDSYGASVLASDKLIKSNPELLKRFVAAYIKAEKAAAADPEAAVAALKQAVPEIDAALAVKQLKAALALILNDISASDGLGAITPARLDATWSVVATAQGLAKDALDPETVVDRDFLPSDD